MADGFHHLSRRAEDLADRRPVLELAFRASVADALPLSNELAARRYIDGALTAEPEGEAFRALRALDSPAWVPALALQHELRSPFGDGSVVRFRQVFRGVPVKGARAMVELSRDQDLSHLNLEVADEAELNDASRLPPQVDALTAAGIAGKVSGAGRPWPVGRVLLPQLVFVHISDRGFVLCWRIADVEMSRPSDTLDADVGGWESPQNRPLRSDLYLDAATGDPVLELSRSRAVAPPFLLPIVCSGDSEDRSDCRFDGSQVDQDFQMVDPRRHTVTHDFNLQPYTLSPPPPTLGPPVSNPTPAWAASNRAAVTANVNAQVVHDFLESLFHRQSIDGQQMSLISVVNCARSDGDTHFPQAYWDGERMLYGQVPGVGRLVSMATHLDVVAHELCHGLTQHTANLRYLDESGALNESISDILGVIVGNRTNRGQDTSAWCWEIGAGLGPGGGPLRNLANPGLGDPPQPQHMNDYMSTTRDNGGVHYNSGIHNRAAYLVLTATLPNGSPVLTPDEVAQMYYFILLQLTDNATFSDAKKTLVNSIATRYRVLPDVADRVEAIKQAYDAVGIV
jgi:bacillolysin